MRSRLTCPVARCLAALAGSAALLVLLAGSNAWAQTNHLPIDQQRKIFFDAMTKVLNRHPDVASEVRVLGVGSWMKGAGVVNDIDATLGHPDPGTERQLVNEINAEIKTAVAGVSKDAVHDIKLIWDKDVHFDELFRGETGQKFVFDYATKRAPDGLATFAWRDGRVVSGLPAENFWLDTSKKLPTQITQPQRFFDDSYLFVKRLEEAGKAPLDRAMSTAKYLDNIDRWLIPGMEAQYKSGPLSALKIDEATRQQMEALVKLKSAGLPDAQLRVQLAQLFKVPTYQLDSALVSFTKGVENYLERTSVVAGFIDGLGRAGKLEPSLLDRVLTSALGIADRLGPWLGKTAADRAMRFADIALVAYQGATEGWHSAMEQLSTSLIGWGVPESALIGLVAEIGRAVVVGGVTLAGNTLFFNSLNDQRLRDILDPTHPFGVFGGQDFPDQPNPFKGLNRETLYYRFRENSADDFRSKITPWAEIYVKRWRESGSIGFATAGAGAFPPDLIVNQLVADWVVSRRIAASVKTMELELKTAVEKRPETPFAVRLDGTSVAQVTPFKVAKRTKPNQTVTFTLTVAREFGTSRFLRSSVDLFEEWGTRGGLAKVKSWLAENWNNDKVFFDRYDDGRAAPPKPENLMAEVFVRGATLWQLNGLPVNLGTAIAGAASGTGPIAIAHGGPSTDEPFKTKTYRLAFTPAPDAKPVVVLINLDFTDTFGLKKPFTTPYRLELTASLEPVVDTMAPPVVPDRGRDRVEPPPRPEPAAPPKPTPVTPTSPPAPLDYSVICQSAMVAIERGHRASYGPQAQVRIEWIKPFAYDKGDCVGGYVLWVKRPEDKTEWAPLRWFADTGAGRVPASGLSQLYSKSNPDLQWTPATATPAPSSAAPSRAADEAAQLEQARAAAAAAKAKADQTRSAEERARAAAERARELDAARKQEAQAPAATNAGDDSAQKWDALRAQAQRERERQARLKVPGPTPEPTAPPGRPQVPMSQAPAPQPSPAPRAPAPPPAGPVAGSAIADGTYTIGFAFDGKTFNGSLDVRNGRARGTVTARVEGELLLPGNGIRLIGGTLEVDGSVSGQTITGSYTLTGSARLKGLYGGVVRASNFNVAGRGTLAVQIQPGGRLVWTSDGELHVPAQPDWPGDGHKTGPVTGTWSPGASSPASPPAAPCPPAPIPGVGGLETNLRCFGIPK